jgi:hypothetical protein
MTWCPDCKASVTAVEHSYDRPSTITNWRPRGGTTYQTVWSRVVEYVCSRCNRELTDLYADTEEDYKRRRNGRIAGWFVMFPTAVGILSASLHMAKSGVVAVVACIAATWIVKQIFFWILQAKPILWPLILVVGIGVPTAIMQFVPPGSSRLDVGSKAMNAVGVLKVRPLLCGSADPPFKARLPQKWGSYECKGEDEAGASWSSCLPREAYSPTPGTGCPGDEQCCPP